MNPTDTINQMRHIIRNNSRTCKSDLEVDKKLIVNAPAKFAMIWIVTPTSSDLLDLTSYRRNFFQSESMRYRYAAGNDGLSHYISRLDDDDRSNAFLINENGLCWISPHRAKSLAEEYVKAAVHDWYAEGGTLPSDLSIPIVMTGISPRQLRAIFREDAAKGGTPLIAVLRRMKHWTRVADDHIVRVNYYANSNEFGFTEYINGKPYVSGGIIFHGRPESGYLRNNSYQLTPEYGWASHS